MHKPSLDAVLDFQRLFESGPGLQVVLSPERNYEIVAVTDSYLGATVKNRDEILGRSLFEVFSDNPGDSGANAVRDRLRSSFEEVVRTGKPDIMTVQKYDICRSPEGSGFEERYWRPINCPFFSPDASVRYVIHCVEDVTELVQLKRHDNDERQVSTILQSRAENSEAELFLREREIQDLNSQLRAADAAQLDMQAGQLVKADRATA